MNKSSQRYWLGFDLGGTKMLSVLYDAKFEQVARKRKRTKGHEGEEVGIQRIVQTVHAVLEEGKVDAAQLGGIGVGCPGPVDLEKGIIREAVNLGWKNVPLRKILENEFKCPVEVLNDVDAGVYAENRFGAAEGARTVIGVFPGTGIGGGCVYEGAILRGKRNSCMEVGHIRVRANGKLCGCGQRGCLETEASRLAISAEAAKAAFRGEAPNLYELAGTDLSQIRSSTLADAIKAGDKVIETIVKDAAAAIGEAVASLVHLMAPDTIVLGGGLVEAMPELFLRNVRDRATKSVMPSFAGSFQIVAAKLGDDANVLGAAAWAEKIHQNSVPK